MTLPSNSPEPYVSQEAELKRKARRFIDNYPDAHGLAYAAARRLIHQQTGLDLDPDEVWWHRFGDAQSSPRTFTGWAHVGRPVQSSTLTGLVMHRFDVQEQQAGDDLQVYGGFYRVGPQDGVYDQHCEVPMRPQALLAELWKLDFAAQFRNQVAEFWVQHGDDFCELARARFLAALGLGWNSGQLSEADVRLLLLLVKPWQVRVGMPGFSVRTFDIGGWLAGEVLRVVDARDRQILYMPGRDPAFEVFESPRQLYEWLRRQVSDAASSRRLQAMLLTSAAARQQQGAALAAVFEQIKAEPWLEHDPPVAFKVVNQQDQAVDGDLFEHLRRASQQQMQAAAQAALTSNAEMRKQIWLGELSAFLHVFGPMAMLAWPMALVVVGAGLASVALNLDQAINGKTAVSRKAGAIGAVLNGIFVLFNLPLLRGTAVVAESASLEPAGSLPRYEVAGAEPAVGVVPLAEEADALRPMQGVETSANGETWVRLHGVAQRVRYSAELRSWLIVDPTNPYGFFNQTAVRLNAQGDWESLPVLRLRGGTPMDRAGSSRAASVPYAVRPSSFWDVYMRLDMDAEEQLSELAVARQREVINVREVQPGDRIVQTQWHQDLLIDANGNRFRVFRAADGRYSGGRVQQYTERDEDFNQFLRSGTSNVPNQMQVIRELGEDLESIGFNNDVALYRGGSGARGTSGVSFRSGRIRLGDVLVNTDFTSFSENPYVARAFSSSQAGAPSYGFSGPISFDDTSIVFELPAESYMSATPIAPFAVDEEEAESLFAPGHYFRVQGLSEVVGSGYRFMHVRLAEVTRPGAGTALFDLRTGEPFDRAAYAGKLGEQASELVDAWFPPTSP